MTSIVPHGELLRRAIRWISEQRVDRPDEPLAKIVNEACLKFDLSPAEQETLLATFTAARG